MECFLHDLGYAVRVVHRRPALSLVIIVTLALGIGANTAIFSLIHTVLLRPLPYPDAGRLVMVWEQKLDQNVSRRPISPANFFEWKPRATSFTDLAWSRDGMFTLTGDGEPDSIIGYRFSANMLGVLGVEPALGRGFRADDDRPGAAAVVLLSDKLWQRRYARDPAILGRSITLDGTPHTVIGIMPPEFEHPRRAELWTPVALTPELAATRAQRVLRIVGRLKPGVSKDQASAEVASLYTDLASRYPENAGVSANLAPLVDNGDAKPLLLVLFAGVGFVLLIACANVANLLLADATARRRELAVRSALGGSRFRIVRQILTEAVLLSLAGGALGAFVTWWTRDALVLLFPTNIFNLDLPLVERIDMGASVFAFSLIVSLATGVLFGLLPAWSAARADLQASLKDGDRGGSRSRGTHGALVVAEVALSVVLLAGAILMVQSFVRLQQQSFGFDVDRVMTGRVLLPAYRYGDDRTITSFAQSLVARLRAIPGVEAAGIINYLPLSGWNAGLTFAIEGRPAPAAGQEPAAGYNAVTEDYFRAMGIRLLSGRWLSPRDDEAAPRVVVINETLARRHWPGENPVGRRILLSEPSGPIPVTVVGVAADVKKDGLEAPVDAEMFFSYWQFPDRLIGIVVRAAVAPASLAGPLRGAVWAGDREQPVTFVMPMSDLAAESIAFRRAGMLLAAGFGVLALVLAGIGIYGVLSYAVTRRTREMGVRMALGATRREVASLVLREALRLIAAGVILGLAAAFVLSQYLGSVLYAVRPGEPLTYLAAIAILLTVSILATLVPAWRATTVDPLVALRTE